MDQLPICLATCTAADVHLACAESREQCIAQGVISQAFYLQYGPHLDNARNNMIRMFTTDEVRKNCTHLLMVDSDIGFTPDDVRALYDASQERAVVGGIYYSVYDGIPKPVVYDWAINELDMKTLEPIEGWDDGYPTWPQRVTEHRGPDPEIDPIVRVQGIGAGFLMIRYEVIDVLYEVFGEPQPWFHEPVIDGIHYGEDLAFCQRVINSGFGVWAHRGIELSHYKNTLIGPTPGDSLKQ